MENPHNAKAIWLIKRDFRLFDNAALYNATLEAAEVMPVYCFEDLVYQGLDWGRFHSYAIVSDLTALRKNLQHHASDVYVCSGELIHALTAVRAQYPFTAMYAHEETGLAHTFARDKAVAQWCRSARIQFKEYCTNGVIRRLKSRDDWERQFKRHINSPILPVPK